MVDHLKAVGVAIKKSPQAIRKKFAGDRAGHEVLEEDWYHSEDPVNAGITFFVKYLGSTAAQKTHGPGSTDEPVKKIVQNAKFRSNKLQKMKLTVSAKSLILMDADSKSKLDEIPLYRVSYCTVDVYYDKVFCYISRNGETKQLECHAFLCNKRSKAEAITLTVAQAFNIAYEKWQTKKKGTSVTGLQQDFVTSKPKNNSVKDIKQDSVDNMLGSTLLTIPAPCRALTPTPLPIMSIEVTPSSPTHIDTNPFRTADAISPMPSPVFSRRNDSPSFNTLDVQTTISKAKSLDQIAVEDEFDLEFQRLAEGRSNPNLLDIGDLNRTDISGEVKQYMIGDRSSESLAHSKSHDNLMW